MKTPKKEKFQAAAGLEKMPEKRSRSVFILGFCKQGTTGKEQLSFQRTWHILQAQWPVES